MCFQAVTIIGAGLIGVVGTWIGLRYQGKLKEREIQSETGFKARELIFNIRKTKYERSSEQAEEVMKGNARSRL